MAKADDAAQQWRPDVLGPAFEQLTLPLGTDNEGDVVATLVRHTAKRGFRWGARGVADGCDVLAVHGWSDYFFNRELAEYWTEAGARFFALDLRKYGRSLRRGQTPGFITSLENYDADIEAALEAMGHGLRDQGGLNDIAHARRGADGPDGADGADGAGGADGANDADVADGANASTDVDADETAEAASARHARLSRKAAEAASRVGVGGVADHLQRDRHRIWRDLRGESPATRHSNRPLILVGHSTGGLVLSLWAARHRGRASAVVLNSPWLEFQLSRAGRNALAPVMEWSARLNPTGAMPNVDLGFYTRTVAKEHGGEWEYNHEWRPDRGFRVHPAWLTAVLAGHRSIEQGVDVGAPVLSLISARSTLLPRWDEAMRSSDIVLVVDQIAERSVKLGSEVALVRLDGAIHDVFLSSPDVRSAAYAATTRWLRGYLPAR